MTIYNSSYQSLNPLVNQLQLIKTQLDPNSASAKAIEARLAAIQQMQAAMASEEKDKQKQVKVPLKNGSVASINSIAISLKSILANLMPNFSEYQQIQARLSAMNLMRKDILKNEQKLVDYAKNSENSNAKQVRKLLSEVSRSKEAFESPFIQNRLDKAYQLAGIQAPSTLEQPVAANKNLNMVG